MQPNYKENEQEKMAKHIDSPLFCVFCSCYTERNTEKESQANWKADVLFSKWDVRTTR